MFMVGRPDTLEMFIPPSLSKDPASLTRNEFIASLMDVTGVAAYPKIKCVQKSSSGKSYRVTFKPGSVRVRDNLLDQGLYLKGCFSFFSEVEVKNHVIHLADLPCEIEDEGVKDYFDLYGEVKSVIRCTDEHGFETGDRRIRIILRNHVPATIQMGPFTVRVSYKEQPLCCYHCNWWHHTEKRCGIRNKGRCRFCGSAQHTESRCFSASLIMPPKYPVHAPAGFLEKHHPGMEEVLNARHARAFPEPTPSELSNHSTLDLGSVTDLITETGDLQGGSTQPPDGADGAVVMSSNEAEGSMLHSVTDHHIETGPDGAVVMSTNEGSMLRSVTDHHIETGADGVVRMSTNGDSLLSVLRPPCINTDDTEITCINTDDTDAAFFSPRDEYLSDAGVRDTTPAYSHSQDFSDSGSSDVGLEEPGTFFPHTVSQDSLRNVPYASLKSRAFLKKSLEKFPKPYIFAHKKRPPENPSTGAEYLGPDSPFFKGKKTKGFNDGAVKPVKRAGSSKGKSSKKKS